MAIEYFITKRCNKCKTDKPPSEFYKDRGKKDGLNTLCKLCRNASHAIWRAENPEMVKSNNDNWYKTNAERSRAYSAAYRLAHPESTKAKVKEWRQANPDKQRKSLSNWCDKNREYLKEKARLWYVNNKDKARIYRKNRKLRLTGGKLSTGIVDKLKVLQKGKCACGCGKSVFRDYHLDHIIPLIAGGENTDSNIQLLTARCNLQKGKKHPIDFMRQRGFLL